MKKLSVFLYGLISYLLFMGIFVYLIGFLADVIVPKSIDRGVFGGNWLSAKEKKLNRMREKWKILEFTNPVCGFGDVILDQAPGTFPKYFVIAKAAKYTLSFPWVMMVHELEV